MSADGRLGRLRRCEGEVVLERAAYRAVFLEVDRRFAEVEGVAAVVRQELALHEREPRADDEASAAMVGEVLYDLLHRIRAQPVQHDCSGCDARAPRQRVRQIGDVVRRAQE